MDKDNGIGGQELFALERFQNDTRHMIIFDVLNGDSPYGRAGKRMRLFLSDEGYAAALTAAQKRQIKIKSHAAVIEGYIVPDKKKKRRGH